MRLASGFVARSQRCDVLVVCTGNVCRSPYVAAILRARVPEIVVRSAGTAALVGQPPTRPVLRLLAERHIDAGHDVARSLTRRAIAGARLVLTAERSHRSAVLALNRRADPRVFTLKEFARLLSGTPAPTGRGLDAVLEHARLARVDDALTEHDDDLLDPYGLEPAAYATMALAADAALATIAPVLKGALRQ